jgi:uncharacterized damage-inducible protein DinB
MHRDPETLVAAAERARQRVIDLVEPLSEAQAAFKPASGGWSVVELVEHLYLAEMSGLAKIWLASDELRNGRKWTAPNPNTGKSVEQIIAETWKAREVAPPIATPHIGGPLSFWLATYRSQSHILRELADRLRDQSLTDVVFPHYLSGPMDAAQRLDFLRFHMERHRDQMLAVIAEPGFPGHTA